MIDWIAAASPRSVLDPAVGTGFLIHCCQQRCVGSAFTGYDIDPLALELAERRLAATKLYHQDFLAAGWDQRFDAIVANPPYIIHRDHDLNPAIADLVALQSGQKLSRQSNLFVYFVIKICEQLAQGGRAAILIPAEWMAANYGQPLKSYLLGNGLLKALVTMDHAGHAFADNMATASILLIERNNESAGRVKSYYVPEGTNPDSLAALDHEASVIRQNLPANLLQSHKKWDSLLRQSATPPPKSSVKLGDLVTTKRGIATGANRFFLLSREDAERRGLETTQMDRCVGKTAHVADIRFTNSDFARLSANGQACYLFNPEGDLTPAETAYIQQGERLGIPLKHGPRTKRTWYAAEARQPAPIWASSFGRGRMRFVHNAAQVKALTCFHSLYPKNLDSIQTRALVALLNSEALQSAIAAQVRRFSSGLMKLEPRDILDIEIPDIRRLPEELVLPLANWLDHHRAGEGGDAKTSDSTNEKERDKAVLDRLTASVFAFFNDLPAG